MSIVDFNTSIWKDSWFRKLSTKAKNLFVFLWTNDHKNLACLYEIDIETISFYTGLSVKDVKDTLSILYPKVKYDYENGVVWVVNFVRHQFMRTEKTSPKIKAGINNNLIQNNGHFFIKEFLEEYQELELSYSYPINRVSEGYRYPPGEGEGEGKGKGNKKGRIFNQKDFDSFILAYPNPQSKKEALERWKKLVKSDELPTLEILLTAIKEQILWRQNANGAFRPGWKNPATWLNKGCWEDEIGINQSADPITNQPPIEEMLA